MRNIHTSRRIRVVSVSTRQTITKWALQCILDEQFFSRAGTRRWVCATAKSARPATNLPSATFLQPFYHMQHSCNIICNMMYSATYLQHMLALAATRIACNIVCNFVCNTVIVCNTSFHQTPFECALGVEDSNSRRASSHCFSPHTRPICAAILWIRPFLLFASGMHTCSHHIVAFFHFSKDEKNNLIQQTHMSCRGLGNVCKYCKLDKFELTPHFVIQEHHCIALLISITQHQKS